eukprot:scaffold731_cov261-Pinguiococcus_pyrenoidosus.AAC.29
MCALPCAAAFCSGKSQLTWPRLDGQRALDSISEWAEALTGRRSLTERERTMPWQTAPGLVIIAAVFSVAGYGIGGVNYLFTGRFVSRCAERAQERCTENERFVRVPCAEASPAGQHGRLG